MKNVQVIDAADNCTFSVFEFTDEQFSLIFPRNGQDLVFAEELEEALSEIELGEAFEGMWDRPVDKQKLQGLHGTLFYGFDNKKHYFPKSRRECDSDDRAVNHAQRQLNTARRRTYLE